MSDLPNPINRYEKYLNAIANGTTDNLPTPPITREEVFLDYIARNGGGGGGGAVTGVKGSAESTYRTGNVDISASNIGLGNVDNTSDLNKPISTATQTALNGKVSTSSVGSANGVAELDANGRVPSSQLPSYVDDVLEYADLAHFPATGESGKIYIAEDTNKTYRWSGSDYAEISESLALGETSSTAYAGNKGKANADAIAAIKDGTNLDSFADVEDAFNYLTFEGTQAEWNLLSTAEKKKYKQAIFTDDYDDNPVGNLNALTTTDKSSCVGAINELNGNFNNLKYHKIAESASTGTYAQKLQSLATSYNALSIAQKRSALLVADNNDIFCPVNCNGNWFTVWVDSNSGYLIRHGIDGSSYNESNGNVTDTSSTADERVFALWICEP